MTPLPPHLDEDHLSAWVDGELGAAEVAHAASCAECSSRLAPWEAASRLLSVAPLAPPQGQREAAVAAALAAAQPAPSPSAGNSESNDASGRRLAVVPGAPGAARGRWHRRATRPRVAVAVAAALLVAGLVAAVVSHRGGGAARASSTAITRPAASPSSLAPVGAASGSVGQAQATSSGAPPETRSSPSAGRVAIPPLPSYPGPAALVTALRAELHAGPAGHGAGTTPGGVSSTAFERCFVPAAAAAQVPVGHAVVLEATLTYKGSPAQVFVFDVQGGDRAAVVRAANCETMAVVSF